MGQDEVVHWELSSVGISAWNLCWQYLMWKRLAILLLLWVIRFTIIFCKSSLILTYDSWGSRVQMKLRKNNQFGHNETAAAAPTAMNHLSHKQPEINHFYFELYKIKKFTTTPLLSSDGDDGENNNNKHFHQNTRHLLFYIVTLLLIICESIATVVHVISSNNNSILDARLIIGETSQGDDLIQSLLLLWQVCHLFRKVVMAMYHLH